MVTCPICQRSFDERAYQVVVVGLGSFDSIACVELAVRRLARERRRVERDPAYVECAERSRTDQKTQSARRADTTSAVDD